MLRRHRRLAPARTTQDRERNYEPQKRKRKARMACNLCREKRTGCDGERPSCSRCLRQDSTCVYLSEDADVTPSMALRREVELLRRQVQEHVDFLQHVRTAAEPEALSLVRHLKATENPSAVLSLYTSNTAGITWPSEAMAARASLPLIDTDVEFELSMLHSTMYPVVEPPSTSLVESASLSQPVALPNTSAAAQSSLVKPLKPSLNCDPRLDRLKVGYWTRVPISDELAARALSHYLAVEHPILGFFDASLFLEDLVNEHLQFCSAFLFSSVMAIACQSYSSVDIQSSPLSVSFLEEAEKLWLAERSSDSYLTLAAINCFSVAASWNGRNKLGNHELVADARAMATRLQLLDMPPGDPSTVSFRELDDDSIKNMSHVAWGTYGCLSLRASFSPKEPVRFPPILPIPGDSNSPVDISGFSWPEHPLPSYVGSTFTTMCKFWVIGQEILAVYDLENKVPLVQRVMPAFAESKYRKLLTWADTLPLDMGNTEYSNAHVYLFHALYHTTVLNLFRPFLSPPHIIRLRSFTARDSTSRAIFCASFKQLKRLIYDYRARLPRHLARSCLFNVAVQHVCSVIVQQSASDPSWRFFFRLCFDYWKDVYVQYCVVQALVPAHLALAMRSGAMTVLEARGMMDEFMACGVHHGSRPGEEKEEVLNDSMLDFEAAIQGSRGGARIDELAGRFKELVLFDEFTTGEYGESTGGETK